MEAISTVTLDQIVKEFLSLFGALTGIMIVLVFCLVAGNILEIIKLLSVEKSFNTRVDRIEALVLDSIIKVDN